MMIEEYDFRIIEDHLNEILEADNLALCKGHARLALNKLTHMDVEMKDEE